LFRKVAAGTAPDEPVLIDAFDKIPWSWSPDGKFIAYSAATDDKPISYSAENGAGRNLQALDLWILPLAGDRKPFPFLHTPYAETHGRFSPDGCWLAYASTESGRAQVYVTSFPDGKGTWQGSTGTQPRWRRDGKELFFLDGNMLMAAAVDGSSDSFMVGDVHPLFETRTGGSPRSAYDIAPDGQRFLIETRAEETTASPLTVVVNWPAVLAH
jgi:dipeptidyl aminopeptidase/acylaminoacyl peptidase